MNVYLGIRNINLIKADIHLVVEVLTILKMIFSLMHI